MCPTSQIMLNGKNNYKFLVAMRCRVAIQCSSRSNMLTTTVKSAMAISITAVVLTWWHAAIHSGRKTNCSATRPSMFNDLTFQTNDGSPGSNVDMKTRRQVDVDDARRSRQLSRSTPRSVDHVDRTVLRLDRRCCVGQSIL